ncbi:hypothetical protein [Streptomyces niveus]|uniref:hypothetical protein n=1 Tax=Streptomyces niveus TaxID=193462 RepID=UPI00344A6BF7
MEAGAATVSSSTMGYPAKTCTGPLPDLGLVKILVAAAGVPVVAERGYATTKKVHAASTRARTPSWWARPSSTRSG